MAYRLFSTTRRAQSSLKTLEDHVHYSIKQNETRPHNFTKTSRSPDITFSRRRSRANVSPSRLLFGRHIGTAAEVSKTGNDTDSMHYAKIPKTLSIDILLEGRSERLKAGEYGTRHCVETVRIPSADRLRDFYLFDEDMPIGSGTFGTVVRAHCKRTGEKVAIKSMEKASQPHYLREIEMLKRVNFRGVVRLLRVFETLERVYLVTELLEGGDLFDFIVDHNVYLGTLTTKQALLLTRSMFCSLEACHLQDFAHLDVKPENFVFRSPPTDLENAELVLIDFGAAQPFRLKSFARHKAEYVGGMDDYWIGEPESHIGGTASYVSPEVIMQGRFSSRSDMWSMGVTFYMMLTGQRPFDSDARQNSNSIFNIAAEKEIQTKIKAEAGRARNKSLFRTCEDLQNIHNGAKFLLSELTQPDPAMRPSTTEAIHYIEELLKEEF